LSLTTYTNTLVSSYSMGGWLSRDSSDTPTRVVVKDILESVGKNNSPEASFEPETKARMSTN